MSLEDFKRINEPRAQRAIDQLGHIEKSAKSMKIHELDVARLLQPVSERLSGLLDEDAVEALQKPTAAPEPSPAASGHVDRVKRNLDKVDTQGLIDIMIAAGAILQDRRK